MTNFLRRYPAVIHWIIASSPLLVLLGVFFLSFGSESAITDFCREHSAAHPTIKTFAGVVTDWGNAVFYPIYLWFLVTGIRQRKKSRLKFALVFIAVQLAVSLVLVRVMKMSIGKPRPGEGVLFEPMTAQGAYHSMPSGHTSEIYGASMPLVFRYRNLIITAVLGLFAAAVAFSRVYLTQHHPSDIFLGWIMGSFAGMTVHILTKED